MSEYPKIAWCSTITSSDPSHYEAMKRLGVESAIVFLYASGVKEYKAGLIHTMGARSAGLKTHACLVTDLLSPFHDARMFYKAYTGLGYEGSKIMILCWPNDKVQDKTEKLNELLGYIHTFANKEDVDLAFMGEDLEKGTFDVKDVPADVNLSVYAPKGLTCPVERAGTWIWTKSFNGTTQFIGYDFYGFYTHSQSYQLDFKKEYTAQPGDSWQIIAKRFGVEIDKLLEKNLAGYDDIVVPGQHIMLP